MHRFIVVICLASLLSACSPSVTSTGSPSVTSTSSESDAASNSDANEATNEKTVTKADLGEDWPLTVDQGTLKCDGQAGFGAVTITVEGTIFALNGIAKGRKAGADIDPIWAGESGGLKKMMGPLIDEGLKLCS